MADKPDASMLHPDLQDISDIEFRTRTDFFAKLFYWPREKWINWYGDIRKYATAEQYEQYVKANPPPKSDITIGPG